MQNTLKKGCQAENVFIGQNYHSEIFNDVGRNPDMLIKNLEKKLGKYKLFYFDDVRILQYFQRSVWEESFLKEAPRMSRQNC